MIYKQTMFDLGDHILAYLGSFIGIALIGYLQSFSINRTDNVFLIVSFGASAVLLYGAKNSPLSNLKNVFFGNLISAFTGVVITKCFATSDMFWLAAALAVSTSIVLIQITKTLHPPGGATAIIGGDKIKELGFFYIVNPVLSGVVILVSIALVFNSLSKYRHLLKY